jgi:hypothetical protein
MFDFFRNWVAKPTPQKVSRLEVQLQGISIRGRVAYCTTCLETIFIYEKIDSERFSALLSCLWEFTRSSDLSEWEEKVVDFYAESILEENTEEPNYLNTAQLQQLQASYATLSTSQHACIDEIIEVGLGNLYSDTGGYSARTLASTMQVVEYMLANGYPLPLIDKFSRLPFTKEDQHGWGKRVDRSFFQ